MAKLNVLHITTFQGGGAGMAARRLHKALIEYGYNSKFLFLDKGNESDNEFQYSKKFYLVELLLRILRKLGLPLNLEQKNVYATRKHKHKVEIFSFANTAHKHLHEHPFVKECDIIHLHWIANFIDFNTFFEHIDKPLVWTLHDMNPFKGGFHYQGDEDLCGKALQDLNEEQTNIKKSALLKVPSNRLTIVTPSEWLLQLSRQSDVLGRFPHYCIPNGIDTNVFTPKNRNQKVNNGKTNVLFVAESLYNYRKGFDIVLEILKDTSVTNTYNFIAVGHEKKSSQIPHISYVGIINTEEKMSELYNNADIFLLPSREDNLPNSMIESLCCGTPVVGFALGGLPETITNGVNGYLSEDISAKGLKAALNVCKLNINKLDRKAIAKNAKSKYSSEVQAKAFTELYNKCIHQQHAESVIA